MHRRRTGLLILLALQLGLATAVWREVEHDRRRGGGVFMEFEAIEGATRPVTIESGYDLVLQRLEDHWPGAWLFAASMQVDWPTDPVAAASSELPGGGWVIYTFAVAAAGPGPRAEWSTISVVVDRQGGIVLGEDRRGWTTEPNRRLEVATYPISSTVALFAADVTVGNRFRTACPAFRHLARVSVFDDAGQPTWLVTYEDQRTPSEGNARVFVDAMSGEIVSSEPGTLPCEP